jgi:hypothetical protein
MPVIRQVLQKFGYVKLADFGLLLDADDRIVSVQDSSLIDASGGRVVGWRACDSGPRFEHSLVRAISGPAVLPQWPGPASPGVATLAASATSRVVSVPSIANAAIATTPTLGVLEEDEWEWTIALARARAAPALQLQPEPLAHDVGAQRLEMPRRTRAQTVPLTRVAHAPPARPAVPVRKATVLATVAPVRPVCTPTPPPLPSVPRLQPRPTTEVNVAPPRRFPKGTEPLDPVALRAKLAQPLPPQRPRATTLSLGATRR